MRSLKYEKDIWKFLGCGKKRNLVENKITIAEWRKCFRILIEGNNERKLGVKRHKIVGDESEITGREVLTAVSRLKKKKTVGYDGLENEVWKFSGQGLFERLSQVMLIVGTITYINC